mmetsp:Transcript_7621/g.11479  ORF Transcript_7621/g.11479 Transcript_7621/m.11479 type:complete len:198 (-) Transcript_7621:280-873(-)
MDKENVAVEVNRMDGAGENTTGKQVNEHITVEQFLQQKCEILLQELKQHAEIQCGKLKNEFEEGKTELLNALSRTTASISEHNVILVALSGPYEGKKWTLCPRNGDRSSECWLGRSSGRKFRDRGLSLPRDGEVSTSHGKITAVDGKIFYTDTGSTNGSLLDGVEGLLEHGQAYELTGAGAALTLGGTRLSVTLEAI